MTRALTDNERGNINFDFLVGLVIFMTAFIYIINAVPGIFVPYQTNAIDLSSMAYRTSSILAEDPGWWQTDEDNFYTDWESVDNMSNVTRLGLCMDKRSPNVLSYNKILKMDSYAGNNCSNYNVSCYKLGLRGTLSYNYSLLVCQISPDRTQHEILNVSNNITTDSIESIDRLVLIRYGEGLYIDCNETPSDERSVHGDETWLMVNRSPSFGEGNISLRITNFTGNLYNSSLTVGYFLGPDRDDDQLIDANYGYDPEPNQSLQYYIYKSNDHLRYSYVEYPLDEDYAPTDTIDIVIDGTKLNNTAAALGTNVSCIVIKGKPADSNKMFPDSPQAYSFTNPDYRYFDFPGIMKLRMWDA